VQECCRVLAGSAATENNRGLDMKKGDDIDFIYTDSKHKNPLLSQSYRYRRSKGIIELHLLHRRISPEFE
jgi:hypothetical protein